MRWFGECVTGMCQLLAMPFVFAAGIITLGAMMTYSGCKEAVHRVRLWIDDCACFGVETREQTETNKSMPVLSPAEYRERQAQIRTKKESRTKKDSESQQNNTVIWLATRTINSSPSLQNPHVLLNQSNNNRSKNITPPASMRPTKAYR